MVEGSMVIVFRKITGQDCGWKLKGVMIDADGNIGCNSGNDSHCICHRLKRVSFICVMVSNRKNRMLKMRCI